MQRDTQTTSIAINLGNAYPLQGKQTVTVHENGQVIEQLEQVTPLVANDFTEQTLGAINQRLKMFGLNLTKLEPTEHD
jgi:hypothetical protein